MSCKSGFVLNNSNNAFFGKFNDNAISNFNADGNHLVEGKSPDVVSFVVIFATIGNKDLNVSFFLVKKHRP